MSRTDQINFVYANALFIALLVTDPLYVPLMWLLVIPGTYIGDWILHSFSVTWSLLLGSALIFVGALSLELPESTWRQWGRRAMGRYMAMGQEGSGNDIMGMMSKSRERSRTFTISKTV